MSVSKRISPDSESCRCDDDYKRDTETKVRLVPWDVEEVRRHAEYSKVASKEIRTLRSHNKYLQGKIEELESKIGNLSVETVTDLECSSTQISKSGLDASKQQGIKEQKGASSMTKPKPASATSNVNI
ncbi:hypothetical protein BT96DRAFT_1010751 [Gymnopus androsaceus JB14]|uniref:Uncharacterized protein n=1 Tax=Gymnopus androsaceus JB14 TaxID=1447944 RepID=A0A6A4GA78_9AGAR|nr:hypothetical protein BT96DRAFT_1010751 [Gymnopus androsaceus JB14]